MFKLLAPMEPMRAGLEKDLMLKFGLEKVLALKFGLEKDLVLTFALVRDLVLMFGLEKVLVRNVFGLEKVLVRFVLRLEKFLVETAFGPEKARVELITFRDPERNLFALNRVTPEDPNLDGFVAKFLVVTAPRLPALKFCLKEGSPFQTLW
jgi:hypothetical protein